MSTEFRYVDTWAIVWPSGRILCDDFETPEEAWKVGLGWPADSDIQSAKKNGVRCERVKIKVPA